jgi:uncharacterized protein (TIGR03435 family)
MLLSKSLSLLAVAAIPVLFQTPTLVQSQFEVASVKRNNSGNHDMRLAGSIGRYSATNTPLRLLIQVAYHVQEFQIIGAPSWIDSERYDIEGKAKADLSSDQRASPLLQALIEERFKAVMHRETKDLPVYLLTIAKSGSKLQPSKCLRRESDKPDPPNQPRSAFCGWVGISSGSLDASTQMQNLAEVFSGILRRKVLDRTGLAGYFDVKLKWTADLGASSNNPTPAPDGDPSIFTVVEDNLA